jgi:hypothetical protein
MNAVNPIDELKEAKRLQQALRKNPNDITSLLKIAAKLKNQELKRKMLNRVLTLDPVNRAARDMLLEMDRAEMNGEVSQSSHASISTIPNTAATGSLEEPQEKLLVLSYSIVHQTIIFALMAISFVLCLTALDNPEALLVFGIFFLLLIIPLWFVSAVVEASRTGIRISRLFGLSRQEIAWGEIVTIHPNRMGQGLKLSTAEGRSVNISSQLHGYPALVEILSRIRPDLFNLTGNSSNQATASGTRPKTFQKGFFSKYGSLSPLVLGFLIFMGSVSAAQIVPAVLSVIILFVAWKMVAPAPYMVELKENQLQTQSFLKKQQLTAQQIRNINIISLRTVRGVRKNFIQIESCEGRMFRLSGFPEGNEIMYGFLKNWWNAYQEK